MKDAKSQLVDLITQETSTPVSSDVQKLSHAIQKCGKISAILFYGSGLWKEEQEDTVYDFYVLVDQFKDFEDSLFLNVMGIFIPPNVYYMEIKDGERTLRCKYALMRTKQFIKMANGQSFTPQIWARFAQPCRLIYTCNNAIKDNINEALSDAVVHFHRKTLPLTPANANARDIWRCGLSATYGAELRSEHPERTAVIFDANAEAFTKRSELAVALLPYTKRESFIAMTANTFKRPFQKLMTFIRLMKATFTFEGSVDYALYKIERQSGIRLEATEFQRKCPLIGAWPLLWKFWRLGAFNQSRKT